MFTITKTIHSDSVGYSKYIENELSDFKLKYPKIDVFKDYELIKKVSIKIFEKGADYGFNIIR